MKKIKFEDVKTQKEAVLWHLHEYENITSWQAIREYGITRLSAKIHLLRKEGFNIVSIPVNMVNRFGRTYVISKYKLIQCSNLTGQSKLF